MKKINTRGLVVTAIMGTVSFILMLLDFSVPFMPSFISFDVSELPSLITSFTFGPVYGVLSCLIKNLLHVFISRTLTVGELSNFILGAVFVFTAGIIYKHKKTRIGALIGSLSGSVAMAVVGVFSNYFIVYPAYAKLYMPMEVILGMYKAILPTVGNLWEALLIFNLPFTFVKGLVASIICFFIYKKLSPILKNKI